MTTINIFRTGLNRSHHNSVRIPDFRRIDNFARAFKHKANGPGLAKIATIFGKSRPHSRRRAVAVISHRFNDHGYAIWAIALITYLFIIIIFTSDRFLNGTVNHVLRHRNRFGLFHRHPQTGVFFGVRIAHFGGNCDLFGKFREQFRTHSILTPLAVLDICPF